MTGLEPRLVVGQPVLERLVATDDPAELYDGPPLWAFFPAEKKWKSRAYQSTMKSASGEPSSYVLRACGVSHALAQCSL